MKNTVHTWFAGELLMRLDCGNSDRFEQTDRFRIRYTGAEANAAIAMSRLGAENVHLLSAVPDNPLGENCLRELGKFGPDASRVLRRAEGRLGLFFLETGASLRPSRIIYDRAGSTFARTPYEAYDFPGIFRRYPAPGWLHLSGTLPALSPVCRELARNLVREAKNAGYTVSFDLNFRAALWSVAEAREAFQELMEHVDVLIANAGVAADFLETPETELCDRFPLTCAALTRRSEPDASHTAFGAVLYRPDKVKTEAPPRTFAVLDRVGGGDAFAGGIIYALQQSGWSDERRINFAAACGALKHATQGDFSLSTHEEVETLMSGGSFAIRR